MGAGEDQTRLAGSTQMAVRNISQLADIVKQGAALIGPGQSDTQVCGGGGVLIDQVFSVLLLPPFRCCLNDL